MKILKYLLIVIVLAAPASAQLSQNKWMLIIDSDERVVYIDTSSIDYTENMLSVWTLIRYKKAIDVSSIDEKVKRTKSKFMFNTTDNTFTVIGALFYGETGNLIGNQENVQGLKRSSEYFININEDSGVQPIYDKALEYANTGSSNVAKSEYVEDSTREVVAAMGADTLISGNDPTPVLDPEPEVPTPALPDPVVEQPVEEEPKVEEPPVQEKPSNEYDDSKDKMLAGNFYTDGNLYCYQMGASKNKAAAEREVEKLKKRGFNAYIMEKYIPNKKSTYYRIRVGFFNSLQEAKADKRKM